jgi:HSP20 family protein
MFRAKSFFEKLTGAVQLGEEMENEMIEEDQAEVAKHSLEEGEGQLGVDVYQTPTEIVIKTMVAGVKPEDLDVAITRDMVTIKGKREYERGIEDDDYFHKELYWGNFSRTILLPQEIDLEESEAVEKHGLLIIKLSKLDKDRQARLKVKGS